MQVNNATSASAPHSARRPEAGLLLSLSGETAVIGEPFERTRLGCQRIDIAAAKAARRLPCGISNRRVAAATNHHAHTKDDSTPPAKTGRDVCRTAPESFERCRGQM